MEKNIFYITLAAVAAMLTTVSCNKNTQPATNPYVPEMQNARIRLAGDNAAIASIDLMANGTYFAELEVGTKYEGLAGYIHLPFERVPVGANQGVATSYAKGTYTISGNAYVLDGIGSVTFDDDATFANLTVGEATHRARTGITKGDSRSQDAVKAPGTWKPESTLMKFHKNNETAKEAEFEGLDLEEIGAYLAENGFPALAKYADWFEGYNITELNVSEMNAVYFSFDGAEPVGGFWNLQEKEVGYSKKIEKEDYTFSATINPKLTDGKLYIYTVITAKLGEDTQYNVSAKSVFSL